MRTHFSPAARPLRPIAVATHVGVPKGDRLGSAARARLLHDVRGMCVLKEHWRVVALRPGRCPQIGRSEA